ncbi:MAG: glycosidase [Flavobacteriaceae bacterium]|nr:glycosidase [Flavobacteriaceae bacterium]
MYKLNIVFACSILLVCIGCQYKKKETKPVSKAQKSWSFPHFEKVDSLNPILHPSSKLEFLDPMTTTMVKWEERNVLNPTAVVKNDTIFLMYRAQDSLGTSRIGMATSIDGLHFNKMATPVFYPDHDSMKAYEWNYRKNTGERIDAKNCKSCYFDGVEDPRIVESENGDYIMTYTSYDGKVARLSIASSKDLKTWTKHGLVLKDPQYENRWSKAGAIVAELKENKIVAKKINGNYWMYFGDTDLFMAYSEDLINWKVAKNEESGSMITVLHPRMGYFDSRLVEPGPFALYNEEGILLIYNSSNASNFNDLNLPKFTYSAGQALFDKTLPYKLLDRTEDHFISPDKDYEKVGEVNEVCFVEGLVYFKNTWFLYYGTADSKIAVAVYKQAN